jgi:hypothetical protein
LQVAVVVVALEVVVVVVELSTYQNTRLHLADLLH